MEIHRFCAEGDQGLAFAHGLAELASCVGFCRLAEFEIPDGLGEGSGEPLSVGGSATELVNRSGLRADVQRGVQRGGGAADTSFACLASLDGLRQNVLCDLNCSFAQLKDWRQLETER